MTIASCSHRVSKPHPKSIFCNGSKLLPPRPHASARDLEVSLSGSKLLPPRPHALDRLSENGPQRPHGLLPLSQQPRARIRVLPGGVVASESSTCGSQWWPKGLLPPSQQLTARNGGPINNPRQANAWPWMGFCESNPPQVESRDPREFQVQSTRKH